MLDARDVLDGRFNIGHCLSVQSCFVVYFVLFTDTTSEYIGLCCFVFKRNKPWAGPKFAMGQHMDKLFGIGSRTLNHKCSGGCVPFLICDTLGNDLEHRSLSFVFDFVCYHVVYMFRSEVGDVEVFEETNRSNIPNCGLKWVGEHECLGFKNH